LADAQGPDVQRKDVRPGHWWVTDTIRDHLFNKTLFIGSKCISAHRNEGIHNGFLIRIVGERITHREFLDRT